MFFSPEELPLSRLRPVTNRHFGAFTAGWTTYHHDRNADGNPLSVLGERWPWGLGVRAGHELQFDLPECATGFRGSVALDGAAGSGGAAIARVLVDGKQVFQSELLVGQRAATRIGPISLDPKPGTRLTLLADPAHGAGPEFDPLDVRDVVDWIEPIATLDSLTLARDVAQASDAAATGLAGWSVAPAAGADWRLVNLWDGANRSAPAFRSVLELSAPVTFTLKRRVAPPRDTLVLWIAELASRGHSARSTFEASLSGRSLGVEKTPPLGSQGEMRPIIMPLGAHAGQMVEIAIHIVPTPGKRMLLDWRGSMWREPQAGDTPPQAPTPGSAAGKKR